MDHEGREMARRIALSGAIMSQATPRGVAPIARNPDTRDGHTDDPRQVDEYRRLRANDAALREVIAFIEHTIGQWERHGPPPDLDPLEYLRGMRTMIAHTRQRGHTP